MRAKDPMPAMISAPCPIAAEAGAAVLRAGATAIEAMIAASAVLTVSYPHFCGLGGDAIWIVADAAGHSTVLSGIGQAAAGARIDGPIPLRGPQAALTSAGLVDSWRVALEISRDWGGTQALAALLEPAIAAAQAGVPVTASQRFWSEMRFDEARQHADFARIFLPGDRLPEIGAPLRQPELAQSLRAIAAEGPRAFYEGALGARIAAGLERAGAPLGAADLAATRCRREAPLRLRYRDHELLAPDQPTQGLATLEAMGILAQFDCAARVPGSAAQVHLLVEAIKQSFLDRDAIADPDFGAAAPAQALLSPAHLAAAAARIDPARALPWPQRWRHGDTVWLGATDRQGNCVSLLQSTYFDWGSYVIAGDTGILWQNRGAAFRPEPDHPNGYAPGKRPFYTLNPGMALREGKPRLIYGTQGADGQPQTLVVLLNALIDHRMTPGAALQVPRFLLGRTFSDSRDTLKIERSAGEAVLRELAQLGHEISPIPALSPLAGMAGVIAREADGTLSGAHDPRGGGIAIRID